MVWSAKSSQKENMRGMSLCVRHDDVGSLIISLLKMGISATCVRMIRECGQQHRYDEKFVRTEAMENFTVAKQSKHDETADICISV